MNKIPLLILSLLLFTLFSNIPTIAQDNLDSCMRQCSREAKMQLRSCKNLSKDCINENKFDPLTVMDYCTDSFVGSCESNINDVYTQCLTDQCGLDLLQLRNDIEFDPVTDENACSTNGGAIINPLLVAIEAIVNAGWSKAACDLGLCPLGSEDHPVYSGEVRIGCDANDALAVFLDTECEDHSGDLSAGCEGFHLDLTVETIDGLQDLQFENFEVQMINGAAGTQKCPYDSKAEGGSFNCSYYGTGVGTGVVISGDEVTAKITEMKARLKCSLDDGGSFEFTIFEDDDIHCKVEDASVTATYDLCAGDCESSLAGVMTYLKVPNKHDLDLKPGTDHCDISIGVEGLDLKATILPPVSKALAKALKGPITDVINEVLPPMPYPTSCPNN